jgi:hypothetical protein
MSGAFGCHGYGRAAAGQTNACYRAGTVVDEREDKNDFVDDRLSSNAFGCY